MKFVKLKINSKIIYSHLTNWHCASVTTQQTSLLTVWERSADTCIPSQVTILRIKPHFMYHDN